MLLNPSHLRPNAFIGCKTASPFDQFSRDWHHPPMQTPRLCELVRYRPAKRQDERLVVEDMEERKAVLHAVVHKTECEQHAERPDRCSTH